MNLAEIPSEQVGKVAFRRERYGGERFKVVRVLAGAGRPPRRPAPPRPRKPRGAAAKWKECPLTAAILRTKIFRLV